MSIASEITRIKNNIASAYTAAANKGATLPTTKNSANLPTCIGTITGGTVIGKKEPLLTMDMDPCEILAENSRMGSGGDTTTNILPNGNPVDGEKINSVFTNTFEDTDLPEIQPTVYVAEGFEGTNWFVVTSTEQVYGNFPKGSITDFPRSMTVVVEPQKIYIYPYTNNEYVNGCLVNYIDDGSQKTLKAYVVYNDNKESAFILVDGTITNQLIPSGYTYAAYIKDVTIPAHPLFTLKPCTYETWTQPNLIADNAYGNITANGIYNNDYKAYKAPNDSDTCWVVPNGYIGQAWWRWQFPEKLLVKSITSRGRTNEMFEDCCWYSDNTKTYSLCEPYIQSTSDKVNCGYKELSEIYFSGYDGPTSSNPGLRNLLITAVKGEHTWIAPEMQYSYVNPDDSLLTYTFSNFMNGGNIITGRTKKFFSRGYETSSFPKAVSIEHFTNGGCTVSGTVFTGGQGKYIALDKLIDFYTANSWEIVVDYTYQGGGSERPILSLGLGGVDYTNMQLTVNNGGTLVLFGSSNNTSWDVFNNTGTDLSMSEGDNYLIKFTYDNSTGYEVLYSQDNGSTWTSCFTSATTTKIRCLKPINLLGNGYNLNSYYSNGTIDMSKCYIKVNNQFVWQPYESYTTYESDGCIVNYTDDGSATTLKAYLVTFTNGDKDIVLSPDNTFSLSGQTASVYLKDIIVPAHDLYAYTDVKAPWAGQPILVTNGTAGGSTFAAWASSEGSIYDYYTDQEVQTKAYYAFDGMNDTSGEPYSPRNTWIANGSSGQWLAFYSPDPLYIQSLTIQNPYVWIENWDGYMYIEGYIFYKGKLQASSNGSDWIDLTNEFTNNGGSNGSYTINVNSDNRYHYFRLYHTTGDCYPGIAEITITALSTQKGFVKRDMSYTITHNTDKPDNITFDTFAYSNGVFYGATKLLADFYYKSSSATTSDACIINYTDDGSAVTLNAYIITYSDDSIDIVLSEDNTFNITGVVSKELVGTVDVPAHTLYEYTSSHQSFTLTAPFSNIDTHNDFVNSTTLVDNTNFRINGSYIEITDSQKYDGVNVRAYMTVTGSSNISTSVTCFTSSEGGYDWGYVYMGTENYAPSREAVTSRITDGHGEYLYVGSGEGEPQTYTYTSAPGTNYFIIGYTKDGSASGGDDTIKISEISFEADSSSWEPVSP